MTKINWAEFRLRWAYYNLAYNMDRYEAAEVMSRCNWLTWC